MRSVPAADPRPDDADRGSGPQQPDAARGDDRHESPSQRLDRNLTEILAELRVAVVGVQVLFAFLLTAAFSARASELTGAREAAYVVAVAASALAALCLIAPVVIHRVVFRRREKDRVVAAAQGLTLVGLALVAVSTVSALWLVLDLVVGVGGAFALSFGCGAAFVLVWVVLPLVLRQRHR
jgi:MFS family permease